MTEPHPVGEWRMKAAIKPECGQCFELSAEWGEVACEGRAVEPNRELAYSWDTGDLRPVVTWTLIPMLAGTRLRMKQTGYEPDQPRYGCGARVN